MGTGIRYTMGVRKAACFAVTGVGSGKGLTVCDGFCSLELRSQAPTSTRVPLDCDGAPCLTLWRARWQLPKGLSRLVGSWPPLGAMACIHMWTNVEWCNGGPEPAGLVFASSKSRMTTKAKQEGDWTSEADDFRGLPPTAVNVRPQHCMMYSTALGIMELLVLGERRAFLMAPLLAMAQVPGLDSGTPMWMVQAQDELRRLSQRGLLVEELLGCVTALVDARGRERYVSFGRSVLRGLAPGFDRDQEVQMPQVLEAEMQRWALFVERHLYREFMEVEGIAAVGALPLLQQQMVQGLQGYSGEPNPELHRCEWIGIGVQFHHDCYWAGLSCNGIIEMIREEIRHRNEYSFTALAEPYLCSMTSQVTTFQGGGDLLPINAGEWAREMSNALWLLYREEGLCADVLEEELGGSSSRDSDGDVDITGDEASLAQRDKPKRKWLADDPARRRRQSSPRRASRGTPTPKSMPRRGSRCSAERVDLLEVARARGESRTAKAKAVPALAPGRPDVRDERPSGSAGPVPPRAALTLEHAVDTWLLVLGIKDIDEEDEGFLPDRVSGSIRETFLGFSGPDRLTMALAFTRVVQGLLSTLGHILEAAAQGVEGASANPATTTPRGSHDDRGQVEVEVEVDDDESYYMQVSMVSMGPTWVDSLRRLQAQLEEQPKCTRALNVRYLLSWLDHRHTNTRDGYWLGHSSGLAADLLALLAAYTDEGVEIQGSNALQEGWARDWGLHLAGFLPVQPGSRMAMGMGPLSNPPVMAFPRPIPDDLLWDGAEMDEPTQLLPGVAADRCVEVPPTIDEHLETEAEEQRWVEQRNARWAHESQREEERVARDTEYLRTMVEGPDRRKRRRVMVVEVSSGSADQPRVARCVRIPLSDGEDVATMQVRMWRDDEEDQSDVETVPWRPGIPNPEMMDPLVTGAFSTAPGTGGTPVEGTEDGLAALQFDTYIQVYESWARGELTSSDVVRLHGRNALDLMQCQWAVQGDTFMEASRLAELEGPAAMVPFPQLVPAHLSPEELLGVPSGVALPTTEGQGLGHAKEEENC